MAPIPITVLGGYLGSGKTTLLNRLLATAGGRRIGVIVNDFGELGVDAALLASSSPDGLVDLPNGCVCCTLGTALGESLELLAAREPRLDQIVIEASGVADPATLSAWGTTPGFADGGTVVLAAVDDVRRLAADRYVGGEVRRQLERADLVLLSKTDLVGADVADQVRRWLATTTDAPITGVDTLAPAALVADPADGRDRETVVDLAHEVAHARWSWRGAGVTAAALADFVAALPASVIRAKGVVRVADGSWREVHVVGRRRTVSEWRPSPMAASGLVVIGIDGILSVPEIDRLATLYLRSA